MNKQMINMYGGTGNTDLISVINICSKINLKVDVISMRDKCIRSNGNIYSFEEILMHKDKSIKDKYKKFYCNKSKLINVGFGEDAIALALSLPYEGDEVFFRETTPLDLRVILINLGLPVRLVNNAKGTRGLLSLFKDCIMNVKYNRRPNDFSEFTEEQKCIMFLESRDRKTVSDELNKTKIVDMLSKLGVNVKVTDFSKEELLEELYEQKSNISFMKGYSILGG